MLRLPTRCVWAIVVATASCHSDLRTGRCDPFRTPRGERTLVAKGEERSAHAPYSAGDCTACHLPADPAVEPAAFNPRVIRPVNDHCVSCHAELFRAAPRGHPPRQSFCTSCHDPHASRQRALLLDEDTARACLDYPPPYREEPLAAPAAPPKAAVAKAPAKIKSTRKKRSK